MLRFSLSNRIVISALIFVVPALSFAMLGTSVDALTVPVAIVTEVFLIVRLFSFQMNVGLKGWLIGCALSILLLQSTFFFHFTRSWVEPLYMHAVFLRPAAICEGQNALSDWQNNPLSGLIGCLEGYGNFEYGDGWILVPPVFLSAIYHIASYALHGLVVGIMFVVFYSLRNLQKKR